MPRGFQTVDRTTLASAPPLGMGMLGYGFMSRAHANAYHALPSTFWPPPAHRRLVALTRRRWAGGCGFKSYDTNWRGLLADEQVGVLGNVAWHDGQAEPCIAAARSGTHGLCEKPLAVTADVNRLHVERSGMDMIAGSRGFEGVLVTEVHPYHQVWWPSGHILNRVPTVPGGLFWYDLVGLSGGEGNLHAQGGVHLLRYDGSMERYETVPEGAGLVAAVARFIYCVREGRAPLTDGREGRAALESAVAADASKAAGRFGDLPLPPEHGGVGQ